MARDKKHRVADRDGLRESLSVVSTESAPEETVLSPREKPVPGIYPLHQHIRVAKENKAGNR